MYDLLPMATAPERTTPVDDLARVVLEDVSPLDVVVSVPGTSYRLALSPAEDTAALRSLTGKRVRGRIEGRALRLHRADAGGRFIEPVDGQPRILQGMVEAIDEANNRVLLRAVVPMWLTVHAGQSASAFRPGELLNGYVESGMRFTPVSVGVDSSGGSH